jgi:hypothetical protein
MKFFRLSERQLHQRDREVWEAATRDAYDRARNVIEAFLARRDEQLAEVLPKVLAERDNAVATRYAKAGAVAAADAVAPVYAKAGFAEGRRWARDNPERSMKRILRDERGAITGLVDEPLQDRPVARRPVGFQPPEGQR